MMNGLAAGLCVASAVFATSAGAQAPASPVAAGFGAREAIRQISLSPDGKRVAIVAPLADRGSALLIADPIQGGEPAAILRVDGRPERIQSCRWATADRLICTIVFVTQGAQLRALMFSRTVAVDADGGNAKVVTAPSTARSYGISQYGGGVIDWTGDGKGGVLMTRWFVPEVTIGTRLASDATGLGVERVDLKTLRRATVEPPRPEAVDYITDGNGTVRIMGVMPRTAAGSNGDRILYSYRRASGDTRWQSLGSLALGPSGSYEYGFNPYAVDRASNVAYGFAPKDGRQALYRVALDGTLKRELVLDNPAVDVDGLIRIGRQQRVVGASFATDRREARFFDPELATLAIALGKALPGKPIVSFIDASDGEKQLLIFAGSDTDPGRYYLYDKATRGLTEVLSVRPRIDTIGLGTMTPVSFPAADGTNIPGYLTLPAGSDGKGLPAIVMPHGGPDARDEWGFDWWAQYFAARGFAVLQPNFRGSSGYGTGWFQKNGFQSWKTAIGDVNDAGRWLTKQGIAAPGKLAIVGWSYGGYAALQSAALDPDLFKAIVAVAPVTDLETLRGEALNHTNYPQVDRFIGRGAHVRDGSPARNAAAIRAPVLMFHGDQDLNVGVGESRLMEKALRDAGRPVHYVEYKGLDHQLDDSVARTDMLEKSDAFLRTALKL